VLAVGRERQRRGWDSEPADAVRERLRERVQEDLDRLGEEPDLDGLVAIGVFTGHGARGRVAIRCPRARYAEGSLEQPQWPARDHAFVTAADRAQDDLRAAVVGVAGLPQVLEGVAGEEV